MNWKAVFASVCHNATDAPVKTDALPLMPVAEFLDQPVIPVAVAFEPALATADDVNDLDYLFADDPPTYNQPITVADDTDEPARASLAVKLCHLLPHLSHESRDQVRTLTIRALEALARDQALRVREALAGAIKDVACAPSSVCLKLAHDVECSVAEPILRCCMTLSDSDLRAIINAEPQPWALAAIARRQRVSAPVAAAIHHAADNVATGLLIDNTGADIPEPILESMVEESQIHTDWQDRLAHRPSLPPRLALRLAAFVDQSVIEFLRGRQDIDSATAREIVKVARRRLEWLEASDPGEPPMNRALRLHHLHRLEEAEICDALSWQQFDFVRCALALRAAAPLELVNHILKSHSPRAVTALAWRAHLSMRAALRLQAEMAGIAPRDLLNARGGKDFPLPAQDMAWELELFGLPPGKPIGLT
ncbi:DUF2336 domain-containing protein [uncultured Gammaproteobacteria bacterium]